MMWLTGPMLLLNLWWAFRSRASELRFVALVGVLGLALMQFQFRFALFGAASMLLTPLLLAGFMAERLPERRIEALLASVLLFGIAFYPTLKNWQTHWLLSGDQAYTWLRPAFPALKSACDERPGVVLADINAGHWIRYHSECSVIGDVFLLTPLHGAKALESARLLRLTPAELVAESRDIRYVFARQSTGLFLDESGRERPDLEQTARQPSRSRARVVGARCKAASAIPDARRSADARRANLCAAVRNRSQAVKRQVTFNPVEGS